jgi:hypothetical protein
VGGATQDKALCAIAIAHAGDQLSRGSRLALTVLGGVRRWLFLPMLIFVVPWLVMFKGGDALSVCFNTIAILFLTEVIIILANFAETVKCLTIQICVDHASVLCRRSTTRRMRWA